MSVSVTWERARALGQRARPAPQPLCVGQVHLAFGVQKGKNRRSGRGPSVSRLDPQTLFATLQLHSTHLAPSLPNHIPYTNLRHARIRELGPAGVPRQQLLEPCLGQPGQGQVRHRHAPLGGQRGMRMGVMEHLAAGYAKEGKKGRGGMGGYHLKSFWELWES